MRKTRTAAARLAVLTTATLAFTGNARADILFVDANADGAAEDGTTWCTAYRSLQDALAAVSPGTTYELRVADGVYTPAPPNGNRVTSFQLRDDVAILGGYAGCNAPDPDLRDPATFESVLSGDLNGDDDTIGHAENTYHVVMGNGVGPTAVLDGVTITGAFANGSNPSDRGGGVFLFPNSSSPIIRNCRFHGNTVLAKGAALYAFDAHATVSDCLFEDNHAHDGGAVYNLQGDSTYIRCEFSNNDASSLGGGAFNLSSAATFVHCMFKQNVAAGGGGMQIASGPVTVHGCVFAENVAVGGASSSGGGVLVQNAAPHILNTLLTGNQAAQQGGGVHSMLGAAAEIRNCTLVFNEAANGGGVSNSGSDTLVASSILWQNAADTPDHADFALVSGTLTVDYSCVSVVPAGVSGSGNIITDPLFADPAGEDGLAGTSDDDVALSIDSPCINHGEPVEVPGMPEDDLVGNSRILCGEIDMGAVEFGADGVCEVPAVPAVTTWGLVIMTLLLAVASKITMARYRTA